MGRTPVGLFLSAAASALRAGAGFVDDVNGALCETSEPVDPRNFGDLAATIQGKLSTAAHLSMSDHAGVPNDAQPPSPVLKPQGGRCFWVLRNGTHQFAVIFRKPLTDDEVAQVRAALNVHGFKELNPDGTRRKLTLVYSGDFYTAGAEEAIEAAVTEATGARVVPPGTPFKLGKKPQPLPTAVPAE